jgi:hypothetical protein
MKFTTQTKRDDGTTEIRLTGWIYDTGYGYMLHSTMEMEHHGYVKICTAEAVGIVPANFDIVAARIAMLEQKKKEIRQEYNDKIAETQEEINKLLALPAPDRNVE